MSAIETVLVVEDDEDDFFLTQRVLRRHIPAKIVHLDNGRAAIAYLLGEGEFADRAKHALPDLVFLDLKMEQGTGHEVLAAMQSSGLHPLPRVFVLTGSNEPRDRELVKNSLVAAGYIVKPLSNEHVTKILAGVGESSQA